jgi:hypothetical protein
MDEYKTKNEMIKYILEENCQISSEIVWSLSQNPSVSIQDIIQICKKNNHEYQKYIYNSPNLTLDDAIEHLSNHNLFRYAIRTIEAYYDVMNDERITCNNNELYYKDIKLDWTNLMYNKYVPYKYVQNEIKYEDYLINNHNGSLKNYNFIDNEYLIKHVKYYIGDDIKELENIIIRNKEILKNKVSDVFKILPYEFIKNNRHLFHYTDYWYYYNLFSNKSLTINNIIEIITEAEKGCSRLVMTTNLPKMFENANITLQDIIANDLHKNRHFYYFASNRNCTISDILNNSDLDWKDITNMLAKNQHIYNDEYVFKFAD